MPTKITTEAVLEQANDQMVRCGINWANLVAQGNSVLAYQIDIEGSFAPKDKRSSTIISASLRTTTVKGDQTTHVDTAPSDIYLFIQQDPKMYRIKPEPGLSKGNWLGGELCWFWSVRDEGREALVYSEILQTGLIRIVPLPPFWPPARRNQSNRAMSV